MSMHQRFYLAFVCFLTGTLNSNSSVTATDTKQATPTAAFRVGYRHVLPGKYLTRQPSSRRAAGCRLPTTRSQMRSTATRPSAMDVCWPGFDASTAMAWSFTHLVRASPSFALGCCWPRGP